MLLSKTCLYTRLLATYILLLTIIATASAQQLPKFHIQSFNLIQLDQSAKTGPYAQKDGNDRLFAIIKIKSDNDDDLRRYHFSFGLIESLDVQREYDGERWLYVAPGAKTVTIERSGYKSIAGEKLPFTTKAGQVYEMVLSAEAATIYMQMLQFTVSPVGANATVMVGGEKFGDVDKDGKVAGSMPLGTYEYQVMANNYHTSSGRVKLTKANTTHIEEVKLRPNFGQVTLTVDADADIYINGQQRARRTWSGTLKAGTYSIECRQDRHTASRQNITVEENSTQTFNLTPPTPITGTLQVSSDPLGATVIIDGKERGVTPITITDLIIGQHRIELRMINYKTEQQTVEIRQKATTPVKFTLSDMAHMTINSRPAEAILYIDGKQVGSTPYQADMASGDYVLRLTKQGWHDYEQSHHLDSSHPTLTLHMSRQYQLPSQYYIQAGLQVGSLMGIEGTIGCYFNNLNIEAGYVLGLNKSEDIFWNQAGTGSSRPRQCQYKPTAVTVKAGYGIIIGTRLRLTPQAGVSLLQLTADDSKASAVSAAIGARGDYAMTSNIALFAAPEIDFALQKGDNYKLLETLSSKIKGWGTGFNLRAGLCLFF